MGGYRRISTNEVTLDRLQTELNVVSDRLNALNKEMMRLSLQKRRERWTEYYTRLGRLTRLQQELESTMASLRREV